MSDTELNAKLTHSYEQSLRGEGRPFTEVFDELERSLRQMDSYDIMNRGFQHEKELYGSVEGK